MKRQQVWQQYKNARHWTEQSLASVAQGLLHKDIQDRLNLPAFPEWLEQRRSKEQEHQPDLPYAAQEAQSLPTQGNLPLSEQGSGDGFADRRPGPDTQPPITE